MSRRHAEESSLDLLLDAMCNTFGGVMFIAILLTVMISIRGLEKRMPFPTRVMISKPSGSRSPRFEMNLMP